MTPATRVLFDLLDHIDKLKALHRANESPSFGQVEALFDHADLVRRSLGVPAAERPASWPTASSHQVERAARHLVELVLAGRNA
jgi:hypothetical protein